MTDVIRLSASGLFTVALRPCTTGVLRLFLPSTGPTVWLRGHRPEPVIRWSNTSIQLAVGCAPVSASVRDLEYDLQLPVERFHEVLPQLEDHGVDLYLMRAPVPDTLTLARVPEHAVDKILVANGLIARFDLPHANEVAVLSAPVRDVLEEWLDGPLRQWMQ